MNAPRLALKSLDEALAELLQRATVLPGVESVSTFDADGRVLALCPADCRLNVLKVPLGNFKAVDVGPIDRKTGNHLDDRFYQAVKGEIPRMPVLFG